ncbi:MAG: tyrosine-type recombinase/integrase [Oligoflexales bacterium]
MGRDRAITASYLNNLVKRWGKKVGIKDNLGSHSLRKSFGYHQRLAGTSIPILMMAFNHSSQFQTLSYLGIEDEELTEHFSM